MSRLVYMALPLTAKTIQVFQAQQAAPLNFLSGSGEMAALMRARNWGVTPLGAPETWPQPLRTAIRLILNTGHPMYIWWGPDLLCFYNDAYRQSIGPERHPGSLGQPAQRVWEEIWPVIGPQIDQVMSGKGATWHENQLIPIRRHGRIEEVYWTYSYGPIDDEASLPYGVGGVLVVCTETTQQVLSERRMRLAEARWRELFDQAPSFMCVLTGPEHRYLYANARYHSLIGTNDIIGRSVVDVLPEIEQQGFITLLDRVYATGETYCANEAPLRLPTLIGDRSLELRYVDFVYQPIRDVAGGITGIFVEGSDVTERVQTSKALADSESLLRDADRRKDEFLATLAHELRNPLAPVRNAARVLRAKNADEPMREWAATVIDRQIQAMASLLDDLLDVSRITRGQLSLNNQRTALSSIVEAGIEVARPLIDARMHDLTVSLPLDPIEIDADPLRLSQVLSNLLTNAAKYMDVKGRIELRAEVDGTHLCLTVKDWGIGIDSASLPTIFDMFSQVKGALDRSEGGLGIGLALVKGIISLHGGRIEAESAGLGQGSEFRVWLPLPSSASIDPGSINQNGFQLPVTTRRILVVDDNRDAAQSLGYLLEQSGHAIGIAHDGAQALLTASEFRPDFAFLDIGLPDMNGYELAHAIRNQPWGDRVVLIALTGWGQQDDKRRAREAGFNGHLTKPVDPDQIEALISETLDPARWHDRQSAHPADR